MSQIDQYFEYIAWENQGRMQTEEARRQGPEEQIRYLVEIMDYSIEEYDEKIMAIDQETDKWRSAWPLSASDNPIGIDQIVDYDESFGPYCRKTRA